MSAIGREAAYLNILQVYEVDPLVSPKCGWDMMIVAVIEDPAEIRRILRHLINIGCARPGVRAFSVS